MKSKFTSCQAGALRRPVRILSVLLILSAFPLAAFAVTPTPTATPKPSATPSATPNVSPQPVNPNFTVSWDKNAEPNILKYVVGYSSTSGSYTTTKDVTTGLTTNPLTYDFTNTPAGTLYIAVKAVNKDNASSPWSNQIAVIVTAPAPAAPLNLRVTGGLVVLNGQSGTGAKGMAASFTLAQPAKVVVRALGPSLTNQRHTLRSTQVELHNGSGALVASNDGWKTGPDADALRALHLAPSSLQESALIAALTPGSYTAIINGHPPSGTGMVEVFQLP